EIDATATTRAVQAIRLVLQDQLSWTEWPHVALDYRKTTADDTVDPVIASWITAHPENPRTASFIQDIVALTRSDAVLEAACSWLNQTQTNKSVAPFVLCALLENYRQSEHLNLFASVWLNEQDLTQTGWTFVWEALARVVPLGGSLRQYLIAKGRAWLGENNQ